MFKTKEQRKEYNRKYYKNYFKIPENKIKNCQLQKLNYWRKKIIKLYPGSTKEELINMSLEQLKLYAK